ncbi:hypothetical protein ACFYYH_32875, partial [Streptomyces sp. NPDC002018]|uniref:hypothetical protein n=1 Tax=Streptomyces sp. NPDC002018 TaxID=3364629 RepID=UPI0036761C6E
ALTFGTLLSSQGTDASFVLTLAGFPPGFPSVLLFYLSCCLASPTLPDPFGVFRLVNSSDLWIGLLPFGFRYFNRIPARLIIEPPGLNFGMPKSHPSGFDRQ